MRMRVCVLIALAALPVVASADDEASNVPVVATDRNGRCYAKSVPSERYGSAGTTNVYLVHSGADTLVDTYSWYAAQMHLQCYTPVGDGRIAVTIVQFGPWSRGTEARADHLAIAFHAGGRLLRSYSTLDIAGAPENVSRSVSHYSVLEILAQGDGFVPDGNRTVFRVSTVDGRRLTFDPSTGAQLR